MEERMFEDLLRRLHVNLSGLASGLLKLLASPKVERLFDVTIIAGQTTVTAPHGLGRQLLYVTVTPKSAVAYSATWDTSVVTIGIAAPAVAAVTFAVAVY